MPATRNAPKIQDRIEKSVEIKAPVSRVWRALTDSQRIRRMVPR